MAHFSFVARSYLTHVGDVRIENDRVGHRVVSSRDRDAFNHEWVYGDAAKGAGCAGASGCRTGVFACVSPTVHFDWTSESGGSRNGTKLCPGSQDALFEERVGDWDVFMTW